MRILNVPFLLLNICFLSKFLSKNLISAKGYSSLIKYLDKNFDKNKTFKCKNGTFKILIPEWLKI